MQKRYSVILGRNESYGMSTNSLATDAMNAISSIPGTVDVQIESESESEVKITYEWTKSDKFWAIEEHLSRHNLRRLDW